MINLVYQQIEEVLANSAKRASVACESAENALRVGAATLRHASQGEITATTILCDVPADDVALFERTVAELSDEYSVEARVGQQGDAYSVRFTRVPPPFRPDELKPDGIFKSVMARMFPRKDGA